MASFDCPTLDNLHVHIDGTIDPIQVAHGWLAAFQAGIQNPDALVALFHEIGFWRDILALTWNMRTVRGHLAIRRMLDARLSATGMSACTLLEDAIRAPTIAKPLPDLVFVRLCFSFETHHGEGTAVAFLVPSSNGPWKAWSLFTRLHALKAHPEQIGDMRTSHAHTHPDSWEDRRRREVNFEAGDPTVLIIGAGHSGLSMAARLTTLCVSTLVIDRNARIGDNWRMRYKSLCLHDTVWYNRMPYLDFPKTWPVFCPASKLGDWLECYAMALDLNVWLSSSVTSTRYDQQTKTWHLSVNRSGRTRSMTAKYLVFATGFGGGLAKMPDIPEKESYRGSVLHSTQYSSADDYSGKKVIVVGACNSAHDIAHDLSHHGCDVTMIQRSPTYVMSKKASVISLGVRYNEHTPVDFADILGVAMPFATFKYLLKASTAHTANGLDKDLLNGLARVGFQTWLGPDGAGLLPLLFERGGGIYIDTGASEQIINGSIKVKGDSVKRFTEGGVELEGGTVLEGDVVIFATGYGDMRSSIGEVCGPDVAAKVGKVWGLDAEGEMQGVWRRMGHPRLWIAMANLARARFQLLHLALQIKAIEEGIVQDGEVYTG